MKVPNVKIEKAASKDMSRPVLAQLYLRIVERVTGRGRSRRVHRDGYLEATNSYLLARVPVSLADEDIQGFIPIEAVTRARSKKVKEIVANAGVKVGNVTFDRENPGTWPGIPDLLPEDGDIVFAVGLNAKLLHDLAEALGGHGEHAGVRVEFQGRVDRTPSGKLRGVFPNPMKPMRVKPLSGDAPDAVGILMPVRISDVPFEKEQPPAPKPKPVKREASTKRKRPARRKATQA